MQNYKDLLKKIITEGEERDTRSGKTLSIFGEHLAFDLRAGFPAVTTKKLAFSSVAAELLMFLNGVSDRRIMQEFLFGSFSEDRWDIWKQDCIRASSENPKRFNGYNLGEMYPEMWRMKRIPTSGYVYIKPKEDFDSDFTIPEDLKPSVVGGGINDVIGSIKKYTREYHTWRDMFVRCYGTKPQYAQHRLQGVTVSPRWFLFSNFLKDLPTLSGYQAWVDSSSDYCLDKDYFGAKVYSRNTCIFLERSVNSRICCNTGIFKVCDDFYFGREELAKAFNLPRNGRLLGRLKKLGVEVEKVEDGEDVKLRPKIFIDQIEELINLLKSNPQSRYMLVDNWNNSYKEKSVLGACHTHFQCYVTKTGELDLIWYQRSSDAFLGLPFNITSYALLSHIICELTGLTPRYLKCTLGDVHVYEGHLEAVGELLSREPKELPQIRIPNLKTLEDLKGLTAKDFELVGYEPHGAIKAPLSVGV